MSAPDVRLPDVQLPDVRLVASCGLELAPNARRWFGEPDRHDLFALDGLDTPVLDVGCGPGRMVAHLAGEGVAALGVDVSTDAIRRTRERGAPVLQRSIFDPLPGTGRWGAALLLDGNIGIGGRPVTLLDRLRSLLRPGGRIVAEVEGPGAESRTVEARIHRGDRCSDWFPWAVVGADAIGDLARQAGLRPLSTRRSGERWFATLQRD